METNFSALPKSLSELQRFDVFEFLRIAKSSDYIAGTLALNDLQRLTHDLPEQDGVCQWKINAHNDRRQRVLQLTAHASIKAICQRCLSTVDLPIKAITKFEILTHEAQYDDANEQRGSEDIEVETEYEQILGSNSFDLKELIEDELILTLPLVPKHDICPSLPQKLKEQAKEQQNLVETEKKSPFSVLAQLKSKD